MNNYSLPKVLAFAFALIILVVGLFIFFARDKGDISPVPPIIDEVQESIDETKVIGSSVEGRPIEAYTFNLNSEADQKHLLFVGGIHGGYEWNSSLLAYNFIDYLNNNSEFLPDNISVSVIPVLNPDGLFDVTGKTGRFNLSDIPVDDSGNGLARFNANGVDLNRNFACKWQPESIWRSQTVSAGSNAFSEPEAAALRDFVFQINPDAVVFWHSQSNAVYASECEEGILPTTLDVMNAYSNASGYKAVDSFDAYPITGDAEGWLASIGIPAVTVELSTHETVEWEKNLAGVKSLLQYFAK